jgi:pimeloyl-ACP methyl ester carboxylesterase
MPGQLNNRNKETHKWTRVMGPGKRVLLHGFPYDIHSFVEVAPLLAARGYRVIVPYMRGHGSTRDPAKSFMRSEAALASAAGRGRGGD